MSGINDRLRFLREQRGWSTAEVAKAMTDAGFRINQSAIWKIEFAKPRRKVSAEEAIGFSRIYGVPIEELLHLDGATGPRVDTETILRTADEGIERFVAAVRSAREARGWTQEELAVAVGTLRVHISELERGKNVPRGRLLFALALVLRLDVSALLCPGKEDL